MAHRGAKRPKLNQRGEGDYVPRSIVEIEIHNFVTYDHLKCKPVSRLNLAIGPNGSRKSSLACAITLGLTREPQAVSQNGETLNQLKALNTEQERDVERVRQKEKLLAKVNVQDQGHAAYLKNHVPNYIRKGTSIPVRISIGSTTLCEYP